MKLSVDDKADKEEPSAAQATGGGRRAYSRKLQGIQDEGRRLSYVSTIELGGGTSVRPKLKTLRRWVSGAAPLCKTNYYL